MIRAFIAIGCCSSFCWYTIEQADALNYPGVILGVIAFFIFFAMAINYLSKAQPHK